MKFLLRISVVLVAAGGVLSGIGAASKKRDIRKIVFDEQRIEGKIRRPQLVLIKAEQRPDFQPMVMQSFGKSVNIVNAVNQLLIERSPYRKAFKFDGKRIVNYSP